VSVAKKQFIFQECYVEEQQHRKEIEVLKATISLSIKLQRPTEKGYEFIIHGPFKVGLKQVVGGRFDADPIEVNPVTGYSGPMNYEAFRDASEAYYRSLFGPTGTAIRISESAQATMMLGSLFRQEMRVDFEAEDPGHGW
jgi:hypothetical protein